MLVIDLKGKSIYPSFIDVYSDFGISIEKPSNSSRSNPQYDTKRVGYYWNDHLMPENDAITKFKYDEKRATELRKIGYGVVNTHIADGIIRGSGILVSLKSDGNNSDRLIDEKSSQYLSFSKSEFTQCRV